MRYRVLVEALKPTFTWIEIESNHPLDTIEPASERARKLPTGAFMDAADVDPGIGLQGSREIESLVVLAVIDEAGVTHYTRSEQLDTLSQLETTGL